jgi:WXG100 family type VII secretion target
MSVPLIRADYEALEQIANRFKKEAAVSIEMHQRVERSLHALQNGGWEGRAAAAFFTEMEHNVLPALIRLPDALEQAQLVTLQLKQILQAAEEEAARPFRGDAASQPTGPLVNDEGTPSNNAPNPNGSPFGDYNNLPNIPYLVLGSGATHQDLAAAMEQLYRINNVRDGREFGVDEPIRIVKIGENDYLVMVAGTDADDIHTGSNDWPSNLSSSQNVPSRYQLYVKQMIEQNIPPGANINLVGHSQGGHVVMNLADTQSLVDQYHINNVISYGSSGSAPYNPRVGRENYHNYLMAIDPIRAIEIPSTFIVPSPGGPLVMAGYPSIDPVVLPEWGGHTDYYKSDLLAQQTLPFNITQWEVIEATPATRIPLDNARLALDDVWAGSLSGDVWQARRGSVDFAYHAITTTSLAVTQNTVNTFTQYMPVSVRTSVDRYFDSAGEMLASGPRLSDRLGFTADVARALDNSPFTSWF